MPPGAVARIVESRDEADFVEFLGAADVEFAPPGFENAVADVLRAKARLTGLWATWSADQRWTPSASVRGKETGWYDAGYRHVRTHADEADAVADFVRRMAAWLARREVIVLDG